MVSVLIGNYNYAQFIGEAIESVFSQTYQNFEICICDDGSTDDSVSVIQEYAARDHRIRFVVQANGGHSSALNSAWTLATGEVVALLDADDIWHRSKLDKMISCFQDAHAAGLATHFVTPVRRNLSVIKPRFPEKLDRGFFAEQLLRGLRPSISPCSALTLRRQVAELVFPLSPQFRTNADLAVMDRSVILTEVAFLDETLSLYRLHGSNLTGMSGPTTLLAIRATLRVNLALLKDREAFATGRYGIQFNDGDRLLEEFAELYIAESLLSGQTLNEMYFSFVRKRWHIGVWRILFKLPVPISRAIFACWWADSVWKDRAKATMRCIGNCIGHKR